MKSKLLTITLLLGTIYSMGQELENLSGTYYSVNNKFERWSIMTIRPNHTFTYSYGAGGCQAEITGTWTANEKRIKFINDTEFQLSDSVTEEIDETDSGSIGRPIYPDLSKVDWEIRTAAIKPTDYLDTGCFKENGRHKRKRNAR